MNSQSLKFKKDLIINLKKSFLFLHVSELKEIATRLELVDSGNKKALIGRICHFLETGEKLVASKFPKASYAQKSSEYPLSENTLMVKGAYKNDLKTRLFFKKLIGSHFHFTAYGIDWLNERWLEGNPPTYSEFAKMWQEEYERRQKSPAAPKEEWAYIRFVKNYLSISPQASQKQIHEAWKAEREQHKDFVHKTLFS